MTDFLTQLTAAGADVFRLKQRLHWFWNFVSVKEFHVASYLLSFWRKLLRFRVGVGLERRFLLREKKRAGGLRLSCVVDRIEGGDTRL
jgi:hypothetical protein